MKKKILGIILSIIGMLMFISLYIMIIICQADYIKHIVTVVGYISVCVFATGIILFKASKENADEQKKEKLIKEK